MKNTEKWPTTFEVTKMVDNVLSEALTVYLMVGVVNESQLSELAKDVDLHARIGIDGDRTVVASLVTEERLRQILDLYEPRARQWRGQYQSLAKALVSACEQALA